MNLARIERSLPANYLPEDSASLADEWKTNHASALITDGRCKCVMLKKHCKRKQERFRHTWASSTGHFLAGKVRAQFIRCVKCKHFTLRNEVVIPGGKALGNGLTEAGMAADRIDSTRQAENMRAMKVANAGNVNAMMKESR